MICCKNIVDIAFLKFIVINVSHEETKLQKSLIFLITQIFYNFVELRIS